MKLSQEKLNQIIQAEDMEYIGLKRVKGKDANVPEYKGTVAGNDLHFKMIAYGVVTYWKNGHKTEYVSGFTLASLIDISGFKPQHEETKEAIAAVENPAETFEVEAKELDEMENTDGKPKKKGQKK